MLEHEQRPLAGDRFSSALDDAEPQVRRYATPGARRGLNPVKLIVSALRGTLVESRVVVGLGLVVAGMVWAIFRGLHFYGLSPVHLAYDLDQPPWLLLLVSGWLWYRSRRR
jgi:hypothetical protein